MWELATLIDSGEIYGALSWKVLTIWSHRSLITAALLLAMG